MSRGLRRYAPVMLAAVAALLALPALADPPARVGRLAEMVGTVSFHDGGDQQWSPASLNYPVSSGNSFWTEPGASADLHVGSTAIHLDSSTELDITTLDDKRFDATLAQGTLNIRIVRFDNGDGYNIQTARGTVTLASPGTYRIVSGNDSDPTRAAVLEGAAQVTDPTSTVSLTHGEEAVLSGTDTIDYQVTETQPTPFDNASLARERREEAASRPAARYVSPEMTGYQDLDDHGAWRTEPTYGAVWYPQAVPADWAPYRYGQWRWVDPWGWTWIDDQPWGFAPFHYGRWAYIGDRWGWTPGVIVARPVYAPALVAFVGGRGWSASLSFGEPSVGWFPLAPQEVFVPSYPTSVAYVRNVNVTNVTNVTNITNQTINNTAPAAALANVRHANQQFATVVPQSAFVAAQPVAKAALKVPRDAIAKAPVTAGVPITPAAAAASGHQEAVTRATRVAQAQGERIQGPPPQAVAKPAAAAQSAKPAPGPAISARGNATTGQTQTGLQSATRPQAAQAQPQPGPQPAAQSQPGQQPAARTPERGAPVWSQNRAPATTAAAPGPAIAPQPGLQPAAQSQAGPQPSARTPERGAPVWSQNRAPATAAAPGPPIAARTGAAVQAPATSAPNPGASAPGARTPATETTQTRPGGAPQPTAAAPGPPIQRAARTPAEQTPPPTQNGQVRNAPTQSAPAATAQPHPAASVARPAARAPVEPPTRAAAAPAPRRPAATAAAPVAARPPMTARAPAPPPERAVQRPVQQTVLQPSHQGWVRAQPPAPAPQQAARPKAAAPAAAAPKAAAPVQAAKVPPKPGQPATQ
jgi:hypothetical protein